MKARNLLGLAGCALAVAAYARMTHPWRPRWGGTEEVRTPFPGKDPGVPASKVRATRAVTLYAPASEVWGWLQQIGQDPGGFYSYSWRENPMGCRLRNADRVVPEWQDLGPALSVRLRPKARPFPVAHLELGPNTTRLTARG